MRWADGNGELQLVKKAIVLRVRPDPEPRAVLILQQAEGTLSKSHASRVEVEFEQGDDARWLAEVVEPPWDLAYGETKEAAPSKVQAITLQMIAGRLEHGKA